MMILRPLLAVEHDEIASWAIAEQWPGRTKGVLLTPDSFTEILTLPGHSSFAMAQGQAAVTGFGQVWVNASGGVSLVRILIDPAQRGQGLGKKLVALLLQEAFRMTGATVVKLRVYRSNLPAVAVYRSLGFAIVASESNDEVLAMAAMK